MTGATTATAIPALSKRRLGTIVAWVLQVVLAFQFVGGGLLKLVGDPAMVGMFTTIGVGQWLRYLVGVLEVAGAVGLLLPPLAGLAALGLAGVMVGATLTNVFILHVSPVLTLALLVVAGVIVWLRRATLLTGLCTLTGRR
ncbi:MAG TPA: DoxX family protein [Propionibacteriaceae bacterium]|nr:DoxX family protein [Propionibacteriaceae bacterium]